MWPMRTGESCACKASRDAVAGSFWKSPLQHRRHDMASAPSIHPPYKLPGPAPRILVAEDELPMRTALEDCLVAEGFRVFSASNGERALARAVKEKPDLLILDVMM